ncbi:GNAT family N-acetyltransferase [Alteromonas facilis]|uniref:GNAT family N-acetyltransferase n=1 Tax=Alteromonas facilis TaxID=2048004 RepID=UPI000C2843B6|nr:GNAT family N-acetyltransferase [Alteromonas facilis]
MAPITCAKSSDAPALAELVFAAAPLMLSELFGDGDETLARDFLAFCFNEPAGQFGYANHFVIRDAMSVVACACVWHNQLPTDFDQATLAQIVAYFGLAKAKDILKRNEVYSAEIKHPKVHQIALGHVSVAPRAQRQGLASMLIQHAETLGAKMSKDELVIDVEQHNQAAIQCYLNAGFTIVGNSLSGRYQRYQKVLSGKLDT